MLRNLLILNYGDPRKVGISPRVSSPLVNSLLTVDEIVVSVFRAQTAAVLAHLLQIILKKLILMNVSTLDYLSVMKTPCFSFPNDPSVLFGIIRY